MRLGQLARKYNITQDEVILFLNEVQTELSPFHHNSKLSSDIEDIVTDHFSLSSSVAEEPKEDEVIDIVADEVVEDNTDLNKIDSGQKSETDLQLELDPTLPSIQISIEEKKDEKSIDTDRLMELLESDEASNDLSKITHIRASKKELSGLKVVGQVELSEPKSKLVDKSESQDNIPKPVPYNRRNGQRLNEEEKNNKRLKAIKKKEEFEARQEKRRIAEEKKKRKAQNKARYERKMQKVKAGQIKQIIPAEEIIDEVNDQPKAATRRSIWEMFWQLFNL